MGKGLVEASGAAAAAAAAGPFAFLPEGGEAGALARSINWSRHMLGPPEQWPSALKAALGILFHSRHPMFLFWGSELFCFYNDAYLPSFGNGKHPAAMGRPGAEVWAEIWPIIHPQIEAVMKRGKASWNVDHLVPIFRNVKIEEVYWTYSYSPVYDERGRVAATFVTCTETTSRVLAERRNRVLHDISEAVTAARSPRDVLRMACDALRGNPQDIPFVLAYLCDENDAGRAVLVEAVGLESDSRLAAGRDVMPADPELLARARESALRGEVSEPLPAKSLLPKLPDAPWLGLANDAIVAPAVTDRASGAVDAFLVLGLSTQLRHEESYRSFLGQLALRIGSAFSMKRAQHEVESARARLYEAFTQAPVATCVLEGPDHVYVLANERYEQLIGPRGPILGRKVASVLPELAAQGFLRLLDEVYKSGAAHEAREALVKFRLPDGTEREAFIDFTLQPKRRLDGQVKGILVAAAEVTDRVVGRRRTERLALELQSAVAARDTFMGVASHELKTPLTVLKFQAQLFQRYLDRNELEALRPERLHKLLSSIAAQGDRLERLVDDMLDISRISTGKLKMVFEKVEMEALVREVAESFAPRFVEAGASMSLRLERGVVAEIDASRVEQVVTNLLTNALRYAPGAPVEVGLSARQGRAWLVVADGGPGIATQDQDRIFERIERGGAMPRSNGMGLGLHICKHIVQEHGGRISVESAPGKGARFIVELPLSQCKSS